jgi:hypothetical protein
MLKRRLLLALIIFNLLLACANSGPTISAEEKKYFQELKQAHSELDKVRTFVDSDKISKARYKIKLEEVRPLTQRILVKYQSSPLAEKESYRALLRAYESYLVARKMWEDDKGMALVNDRMAEGSTWLNKASNFIEQEKKGEPSSNEGQ